MKLERAVAPDFWRRYLESNNGTAAMHPHNNCPVCHPTEKAQTLDAELEVLISCMRTSAQDTLINLHKAGYHIVKA